MKKILFAIKDLREKIFVKQSQEISNLIFKNINFRCDYLEITEFKTEAQNPKRRGIVINSRVHPGESMVSYLVEYMIDFLIGNSVEARILRENFFIYVVPMLNIDGVVIGNYRSNLSGVDLNRQYITTSKVLHPTIYYLKKVIIKFSF